MYNLFFIIALFIGTTINQQWPANHKTATAPKLIEDSPWKLAKDADGIKIYTRKKDGWSIKEYKASVYVKAPLIAVKNALRDTPNQKKWSKNTLMVKEIKILSKDDFYTYSQTDSPWPASDRDNIVHIKYSYPSSKVVKININSVPKFIPQNEDFVRIAKMVGTWHLEEIEAGLTKITQQTAVDPGGATPDWLINTFLVDGPHKSLKSLRDYIQNNVAALAQ